MALAEDVELIRQRWADTPSLPPVDRIGSVVRIVASSETAAKAIVENIRKSESDLGTLLVAVAILADLRFDTKQVPQVNDNLRDLIRSVWGDLDSRPPTRRSRSK